MHPGERNPIAGQIGPVGLSGVNDHVQQQRSVEQIIQQLGAHDGAASASQNYGMYASRQAQLPVQTVSNLTSSRGVLERLPSRQPVGFASQEAPTRPQEPAASSQQSQSSTGSNPPPTSESQQQSQQSSDISNQLNPPPYSPEILNNLGSYSVTILCTLGREISHELDYRTTVLCLMIKAIGERKPVRQNPEVIMKYCLELLEKLHEIRILIDKQRKDPDERAGSILERFMDTSDSDIQKPAIVEEKEFQLEEKRKKLGDLCHDLNFLDWDANVSDPVHLRNTDSMSLKDYKDGF